jgi:hypothetical protein
MSSLLPLFTGLSLIWVLETPAYLRPATVGPGAPKPIGAGLGGGGGPGCAFRRG